MVRTCTFSAFFLIIFCLITGQAEARAAPDTEIDGAGSRQGGLIQPGSPSRLDADRDDAVSRSEADAHYDWLFNLLDIDRDGIVARSEFVQALDLEVGDPTRREARRERFGVLFARLDGDGNEMVERQEFLDACLAHFSTSDRDGDGRISLLEFRSRRPL